MLDNKWFAQYCNLCAANVLNKDGNVRFTYNELHQALNDPGADSAEEMADLKDKIIGACNKQFGAQDPQTTIPLMLTLLNIHAAYLMMTGAWKYPDPEEGDKDEYGFEIF